jgi:hypothetical protein
MLKSTKDELLMNLWFYPIRIHNRFVHTTEKENNQQHHPRIHLELSDLVPAQRAMGGCLGSRRHGDNSSGESSDFAGSGVGLGEGDCRACPDQLIDFENWQLIYESFVGLIHFYSRFLVENVNRIWNILFWIWCCKWQSVTIFKVHKIIYFL